MTLEDSIDRNKELKNELIREGRQEKAFAVGQGIEALTLYKRCRQTQPVWLPMLLPGETEVEERGYYKYS